MSILLFPRHLAVSASLLLTISTALSQRLELKSGESGYRNVQYLGGAPGVRCDWRNPNKVFILSPSELRLLSLIYVEGTVGNAYIARTVIGPEVLVIRRDQLISLTADNLRRDNLVAQGWIGIPKKWPKSTDHLIIIEYKHSQEREAEILLRVPAKHHEAIVEKLKSMLEERLRSAVP